MGHCAGLVKSRHTEDKERQASHRQRGSHGDQEGGNWNESYSVQ